MIEARQTGLKKQMAAKLEPHAMPGRTTPGFVEVPSAASRAQVGPTIEINVQMKHYRQRYKVGQMAEMLEVRIEEMRTTEKAYDLHKPHS